MKRVLIKRPTVYKGTGSQAYYLKSFGLALAQIGSNAVKIDIESFVVGWGRSRQRKRGDIWTYPPYPLGAREP